MTIHLSNGAKGLIAAGRPQTALAVHSVLFSFDITTTILAADKLALGVLPANCTPTDAILFSEGALGAATANVGIMSGTVDSTDDARTSGNELFAALALNNAFARLAKPDALLLAPANADRAIGISGFSADIVGAAGKRLHLLLSYRA